MLELQRIANEHDSYLALHAPDFDAWESDMRGCWGDGE